MPDGKPSGVRCVNLSADNLCLLHDTDRYPRVCASLVPSEEMCGSSREEALIYLADLEEKTRP